MKIGRDYRDIILRSLSSLLTLDFVNLLKIIILERHLLDWLEGCWLLESGDKWPDKPWDFFCLHKLEIFFIKWVLLNLFLFLLNRQASEVWEILVKTLTTVSVRASFASLLLLNNVRNRLKLRREQRFRGQIWQIDD